MKIKKLKKMLALGLSLTMLAGMAVTVSAEGYTGWKTEDGIEYWYENDIKQGLEGRGKEIFDGTAWYWLDSVDGGKKAVSKDVYQEYHKHGNSKKFYAEHEQELAMHQAAKQVFNALGLKKLPTVKSLSTEYEQLLAEKKKLYPEYRKVHEEMQEMLTVRANMEQMLRQDEAMKDQEKHRMTIRG